MNALRLLAAASALAMLVQPAIAPAQETKAMPAKSEAQRPVTKRQLIRLLLSIAKKPPWLPNT